MSFVQVGEACSTHAADILELPLQTAREAPPRMVERHLQVKGVVDAPQDPEVVLEIMDQTANVCAHHVRFRGDGPTVGGESLLVDAMVVQNSPVLTHVAVGAQVCDDRPADTNVLWCCVVVQLLVPLLVVGAMDLLDVMRVHDHKNLVSDRLPCIATATHGRQRPSDPHATPWMGFPQLRHAVCDDIRCASEHSRLCASVLLPRQKPHEGESLPHEDPAPELLLARLDLLFIGKVAQRHTGHPRPLGFSRIHMH
mmetsp:Transcript_17376/g.40529  ORF Transcript_17376/g.40529 Transcript_17376/m.40529 type:complete len:254 (+) Transcript_17376:2113-2874(+)